MAEINLGCWIYAVTGLYTALYTATTSEPGYRKKSSMRRSFDRKFQAATAGFNHVMDSMHRALSGPRSEVEVGCKRNLKPSNRPYKHRKIGMYRRCILMGSLASIVASRNIDHKICFPVQEKDSGGEDLVWGYVKTKPPDQLTDPFVAFNSTNNTSPHSPVSTKFDTDSYPIKVDNCATGTISPYASDFIPDTLKEIPIQEIKGISGAIQITKMGTISWNILDNEGVTREIQVPNSFLVPKARSRLLSPQHWAQQAADHYPINRGTWCGTYHDNIELHWNQGKYKKSIKLDPQSSNVATMWSAPGYSKYASYCAVIQSTVERELDSEGGPIAHDAVVSDDEESVIDEENDPGFISERVQEQQSKSVVQVTNPEVVANTQFDLNGESITTPTVIELDPLERSSKNPSADLLRFHHRVGHVSMTRLRHMARLGILPKKWGTCRLPQCQSCHFGKQTRKPWRSRIATNETAVKTVTKPGACVSVDQLESTTPGLIAQLKGIPTTMRFQVATVFVDHFSDLSFVHLQTSTGGKETLEAKKAFESFARSHGVPKILHYHADNGRFAENMWRKDIAEQGQQLTFCGVSAHHQNGRAEKRIRDLQDLTRTSLIHANRRWPDAVEATLWPYALRKANEALNKTVSVSKSSSPIELFTGVKVVPNVKEDHPFGCPVYALDGDLQNKKKINKWVSRSRLGIYLGPSLQHARSVALVLSLTTGLVSPQYHVNFDNTFETVLPSAKTVVPKSEWQSKCHFLAPVTSHPVSEGAGRKLTRVIPAVIPNSEHIEFLPEIDDAPESQVIQQQPSAPRQAENVPEAANVRPEIVQQAVETPATTSTPPIMSTTRSGRTSKPPIRFQDYIAFESGWDSSIEPMVVLIDPIAFAASSDPDVLHLGQAMKAGDKKEFLAAMEKEIKAHFEQGNWILIRKSDVPPGHKILPAIWAMRRKRRIDTQEVYKWKARINLHGGKQEKGINYWDTYAPVASWASIRLIMMIAALRGWQTRQMDFVLAFPQAPVETPLYMAIPKGFEVEGETDDYCLQLINNLYGQKQAGRVWNKYLIKGLKELGFQVSAHDPCILWRGDCLLIIYTDDTIVTGPNPGNLDKAIADIATKFNITHDPTVSDFLGVKVERNQNNKSVVFTQPQLIDSIIQDLGLKQESKPRSIPALSSKILQRHNESKDHSAPWHYRSVIGKLNYLEKCTRPDIAYAVHQCARFCESPKEEHSDAVKRIGRYLLSTRDKGMICNPNNDSFQVYADADFAGNWNKQYASDDPSTARSRSGYVIKYANCPLVWASKLQTEIAFSSTESEYISLSQALREVIPLMRLVKELSKAGFSVNDTVPQIHCKLFEDNSGALEMVKTDKYRPRTKHINIKYHHFREYVDKGLISVHAISTHDQQADVFTKPLNDAPFIKFRRLIQGW